MGWRGAVRRTPPNALVFYPLLKILLGNPYLKILDLSKLFIVDAPMEIIKYGSENRPWFRGLIRTILCKSHLYENNVPTVLRVIYLLY